MAGAYCKFCGRRCFVYRIVPDGPEKGWGGHMATCREGMMLDLKVLGCTHLTAVNPVLEPEAAQQVADEVLAERGEAHDRGEHAPGRDPRCGKCRRP